MAERVKDRRLQMGWSRTTLAARAGVSPWTLKRFEITGQIALGTLIRIAMAFDEIEGFANLFPERRPVPATMAELEKMHPPARKRGRTVR